MTPHPWAALSCSALPQSCLPFSGSVALLLPSLCCWILLIFSSLPWSRNVTGRRERRRVRWECQILFLSEWTFSFYPFFFLLLMWFNTVVACDERWQSMGSDSEVGNFDRCVVDTLLGCSYFVRLRLLCICSTSAIQWKTLQALKQLNWIESLLWKKSNIFSSWSLFCWC